MTAAQAPAGTEPRTVVDTRTGETVFGPATRAQISDWIIRTGFWGAADFRIEVPGGDTR